MAKLVVILLCLHFVATVYSRDATLIRGSGEAVVDAVIDKIQSSCIFPNDKYFMKRIAAVNTDFGKNMQTNNGGIWKVHQLMINTVRTYCQSSIRIYCNSVLNSFNVNLNGITLSDMEIPLKSALVMRAYLQVTMPNIPASISSQASSWEKIMYKTDSTEFKKKAHITSGCFAPKMDLIFAIDASGSVGRTNFDSTLTFLKDVVGGLKIGPDLVRAAVIQFASRATVSFPLNAYKSVTTMKNKIGSIKYTGGGTNTAAALNLASTTFTNDRQNVLKILVLITDGRSNSFYSTVNAANKLKNEKIIIFTIGVGNVRDSEMLKVSSDPSCIHFFKLSSYAEIESIIHQIQRKACESPLEVNGTPDDTIIGNNSLPSGNATQVQRITVDSNSSNNNTGKSTRTIRVDVVCGVVNVYASSTYQNPNSAMFEDKATAIPGISAWIHSDSRSKLYVSLISQRSADVNNPECTNPHYNISINPLNTSIAVICTENGIVRTCTHGDIRETFKDLFDNTHQCGSVASIPDPCKKTNVLNNKMRYPHPKYRNMYIQCKITGGIEIVICPTGTNYNEQQSVCNPYVAPPSSGSIPYTGPNPCTNQAIARRQFYHTHLTDKTSFIQCNEQGFAFLVSCPTGTVWSQKAYTCIDNTVAAYNPCNSSTNVYFYPNSANKTTYIRCDDYDNAYVMPCPPTTAWSQVNQTCIEASQPVTNNCANPCINGQMCPFPGDEHFYYVCNHQTLTKMACVPGLVWSQAAKVCVWP